MLLIWQQTTEFSGQSPAKELYQGLISTDNKAAADRIRSQTDGSRGGALDPGGCGEAVVPHVLRNGRGLT
ncbi:hypothetical protein CRUP_017267, partial [Coryphaenoides rupestris]